MCGDDFPNDLATASMEEGAATVTSCAVTMVGLSWKMNLSRLRELAHDVYT